MKRKRIIIIAVECTIIFFILVCYYFIFWGNLWGTESRSTGISDRSKIEKDNSDHAYEGNRAESEISPNIEADIKITKNVVNIKQKLVLKEAVDAIHLYIPSCNTSKTAIKNVLSEKGFKNIITADNNLRVDFEGKQDRIYLEYEIILDSKPEPLTYSKDFILLTNFLMTPAVYKDGSPVFLYKSSFGDPYIYDINSYSIKVKTDKDLSIYAPGKKEEEIIDDDKIAVFQAENLRDFPVVIFKSADVKVEKYGETNIYYINSYKAREYVGQALEFGINNIGPYPYKDFFVVKVPLSQKGMELSNMILLSEDNFNDTEILKRVAYHEVFHQWFYGIIGTDQLNEPFFDEGLVNYLSLMLSNNEMSKYYNQRLFQLHLKDYNSKEQYYNLAYNESAVYFRTLHKKLGDDFFKLLQKIYEEKKFSIIYFNEFLEYTKDFLGGN